MSRAQTSKLYRTFVKGLITEAGPLTYPENATIREDNMVLFQAGNRARRKGIDLESGAVNSSYSTATNMFSTKAVATSVWQSADNDATKNFVVAQVGSIIHFYDQAASPLSSGEKGFSVNLADFAINSQDTSTKEIQTAAGKGYLFVVHPFCDPFIVIYNSTLDTIATQRIFIQIRDFKGVDDGLANDEEPSTLSTQHNYNLLNQGWLNPANDGSGSSITAFSGFGAKLTVNQAATTPIAMYFGSVGRYPGNNKQWWISKNSTTGAFDPALLKTFFFGSVRAPRGHYVVEAFNIDRSAVSGIGGIPVESTTDRPSTIAFYAGRVWYAKDSTVYYSQILDDKAKSGSCFQEADPTSEQISDLIATDGGYIPIPEMIKANRLIPIAGGMAVFASNGIWFVGGTQSGFSATDQSITKINPVGTDSPNSIVHVQTGNNDMILWWSRVGIQAMQQRAGSFGPVDNKFDSSIITLNTIQSFYNSIPQDQLPFVKSVYDTASNRVQWLFNDGLSPYHYAFNRILNYDLTLQAFYPWTFSTGATGPYVSSVFTVLTTLGDEINPFTKYFVAKSQDPDFYFTFAEVKNQNFADWNVYSYSSFMETGYELLQDAMRKKEAMYVYCYFQRTEDFYTPTGNPNEYTVHHPSSCFLQVKWDWSDTNASNRWTSKVQAYRLTRVPEFDPGVSLVFNNGNPVTVSRNRVRGHGKAIQFRYENNAIGSDFNILGWSVPYSGNTEP